MIPTNQFSMRFSGHKVLGLLLLQSHVKGLPMFREHAVPKPARSFWKWISWRFYCVLMRSGKKEPWPLNSAPKGWDHWMVLIFTMFNTSHAVLHRTPTNLFSCLARLFSGTRELQRVGPAQLLHWLLHGFSKTGPDIYEEQSLKRAARWCNSLYSIEDLSFQATNFQSSPRVHNFLRSVALLTCQALEKDSLSLWFLWPGTWLPQPSFLLATIPKAAETGWKKMFCPVAAWGFHQHSSTQNG